MATTTDPFPTTRWTIVIQVRDSDPERARAALEALCQDYRRPILRCVSYSGVAGADREDVVQDFLTTFLQRDGFARIDQAAGRARNYILRSLQNFLIDRSRRDLAKVETVPATETSGGTVEADDGVFDREWGREIMERAMENVRALYREREKEALGNDLLGLISAEDTDEKRSEICRTHAMNKKHLSVLLHRFRKDFQKSVREIVASTVDTPDEIEDELHYLRGLWSSLDHEE